MTVDDIKASLRYHFRFSCVDIIIEFSKFCVFQLHMVSYSNSYASPSLAKPNDLAVLGFFLEVGEIVIISDMFATIIVLVLKLVHNNDLIFNQKSLLK